MTLKKLLCACCLALMAGCIGNDPQSLLKKGNEARLKGDFETASKYYSKALEKKPDMVAALSGRAMCLEQLSDKRRSREDYENAIKTNPQFAPAYNNYGAMLIDMDAYQDAIAQLTRAVEIQPDYAMAYMNRGKAYFQLNESTAAMQDLDKAVELAPTYALAHYNRGMVLFALKRNPEAAAEFDKALELKPDSMLVREARGKVRMALSDYAGAADDFGAITFKNTGDGMAFFFRAYSLFKTGKVLDASDNIKAAISLLPRYGPAYELLGDIMALNDAQAAITNYLVAKRLDPANSARYETKISLLEAQDAAPKK